MVSSISIIGNHGLTIGKRTHTEKDKQKANDTHRDREIDKQTNERIDTSTKEIKDKIIHFNLVYDRVLFPG